MSSRRRLAEMQRLCLSVRPVNSPLKWTGSQIEAIREMRAEDLRRGYGDVATAELEAETDETLNQSIAEMIENTNQQLCEDLEQRVLEAQMAESK